MGHTSISLPTHSRFDLSLIHLPGVCQGCLLARSRQICLHVYESVSVRLASVGAFSGECWGDSSQVELPTEVFRLRQQHPVWHADLGAPMGPATSETSPKRLFETFLAENQRENSNHFRQSPGSTGAYISPGQHCVRVAQGMCHQACSTVMIGMTRSNLDTCCVGVLALQLPDHARPCCPCRHEGGGILCDRFRKSIQWEALDEEVRTSHRSGSPPLRQAHEFCSTSTGFKHHSCLHEASYCAEGGGCYTTSFEIKNSLLNWKRVVCSD